MSNAEDYIYIIQIYQDIFRIHREWFMPRNIVLQYLTQFSFRNLHFSTWKKNYIEELQIVAVEIDLFYTFMHK